MAEGRRRQGAQGRAPRGDPDRQDQRRDPIAGRGHAVLDRRSRRHHRAGGHRDRADRRCGRGSRSRRAHEGCRSGEGGRHAGPAFGRVPRCCPARGRHRRGASARRQGYERQRSGDAGRRIRRRAQPVACRAEAERERNVSMAELSAIRGSGVAGRVTRDDLLEYLERRTAAPVASMAPQATLAAPPAPAAAAPPPTFLRPAATAPPAAVRARRPSRSPACAA